MSIPDHYRVHLRSRDEPAGAVADASPLLVLDGSQITSEEQFFRAARQSLPCNPPLGGGCHWDALSDSVYCGLQDSFQRCTIWWKDAQELLRRDPAAFGLAVSVLADIAEWASKDTGGGLICDTRVFIDV